VSGLQLGKLLCRHDDAVDTPVFFYKHRLSFRMGAHGTKSILGLRGCDLHEISRKLVAFLANLTKQSQESIAKGLWIATALWALQ
jgi:hypothetical protein